MRRKLKQLIIILLVILLINVVANVYLTGNVYKVKQNYNKILDEYVQVEDTMNTLIRNVYGIQAITLTVVITDDDIERYNSNEQIEKFHQECMDNLNTLKGKFDSDEELKIYHNLYSNYLNYKNEQESLKDLGKTDAARYFVNSVLEPRINSMNSDMESLIEIGEKKIENVKEEIKDRDDQSKIIIISVIVTSIIALITLFVYFIRYSGRIIDTFDKEKSDHEKALINMQGKTIEGMAELVESRDGDTGTHVKNTAKYVEMIARQLALDSVYKDKMDEEYIGLLKRFAPLHDVGKIVVSDTILLKPGRLTDEEFEIMKTHTTEGGKIINSILLGIESDDKVKIARDIAKNHHEKWNGKGYPEGLKGEEIPLSARIMSVADVFDALISKRCYKKAFPVSEAFDIIEEDSGVQFDPVVVEAFLKLRPKIEKYLEKQRIEEMVGTIEE